MSRLIYCNPLAGTDEGTRTLAELSCVGGTPRSSQSNAAGRHAPGARLEELVWEDLCEVLTHPEHAKHALRKVHGGEWLPQELKARLENVGKAIAHTERQRERLLEAYLGGVVELAEFERKRKELECRTDALHAQERQLETSARERTELAAIADSIEEFCEQVRARLADATFEHKRRLVELLIDRVISSPTRRSRSVTSSQPHRKALTNLFVICVQTI